MSLSAPTRRAPALTLLLVLVAVLAAAPAASSGAGPRVTCASGITAYAHGGIRFFGVLDGKRRPRTRLFVCPGRGRGPVLLAVGRTDETLFEPFTPGARYVGYTTVAVEGGTAASDAWNDYRAGWVRVRDAKVRSTTASGYADEPYASAVDQATGAIVTLTGRPGGPEDLAWSRFSAATSRLAAPKLVYSRLTGAIVPATLATAGSQITYRTRGGARRSIDAVAAPAVTGPSGPVETSGPPAGSA